MSLTPSARQMIEDCYPQVLHAVSLALAAGLVAEDLLVLVLDTGSRVGADPGRLVCGILREELSELSDVPRHEMVERYEGGCTAGDPSEVHSRCLEMLLGPLRDHLEHPMLPGVLMVIAQRGSEVGVVSRLPGTGRYLQ